MVYDYKDLTLTSLLNKYFTKINECIELCNTYEESYKYLLGEGLPIEVSKQLAEMVESGLLKDIVRELNNETNTRIDAIENDIELLKNKYGIIGVGDDETEKLENMIANENIINIPKGYKIGISNKLTINKDIEIVGGGELIALEEGLDYIILINGSNKVNICDITFNLNNVARGGIFVNNSNDVNIHHCTFTGGTIEYGWYATDSCLLVDNSINTNITNCLFHNTGYGYGTSTETLTRCISVGSGCNNTLISGNTFKTCSQAIVTDSKDIRIVNNHFDDVEDNSIYCVGGSENIIINGNTFTNGKDECIVISGVGQFIITNNVFDEIKNKCIAINSSLKSVVINSNNFRCTTIAPSNVIAWRSDKYNAIVDNFHMCNNLVSIPLSTNYELFSFGNIRGGHIENNYITVIATNKIIAFRGSDFLKCVFRNNIIDNTEGTYTTLLDYPVAIATKDYIFDNNKVVNGRLGSLTSTGTIIKNTRIQNTGSTVYINNANEGNILYSASKPTSPIKAKRGDICYNTTPSANSYVGWICVSGDGTTEGTWKGFGLIES